MFELSLPKFDTSGANNDIHIPTWLLTHPVLSQNSIRKPKAGYLVGSPFKQSQKRYPHNKTCSKGMCSSYLSGRTKLPSFQQSWKGTGGCPPKESSLSNQFLSGSMIEGRPKPGSVCLGECLPKPLPLCRFDWKSLSRRCGKQLASQMVCLLHRWPRIHFCDEVRRPPMPKPGTRHLQQSQPLKGSPKETHRWVAYTLRLKDVCTRVS